MDQARRFNLNFDTLNLTGANRWIWRRWKKSSAPRGKSAYSWLWCAHCETSTGILADVAALKTLVRAARNQIVPRLHQHHRHDAGGFDRRLSGVRFQRQGIARLSGAFDGFLPSRTCAAAPENCRVILTSVFSAQQDGTPFTFSSNLLHALHAAVKRVNWERRFAETAEWSAWLRERLAEIGFHLIGNGALMSPAVITIALPPEMNSTKIGEAMQEAGYLLSLQQRISAPEKLDPGLSDGRMHARKSRRAGQRIEPGIFQTKTGNAAPADSGEPGRRAGVAGCAFKPGTKSNHPPPRIDRRMSTGWKDPN